MASPRPSGLSAARFKSKKAAASRKLENGSKGTDHGTAAPHFLAGGSVRGGLIGTQPALDTLLNDDLVHTMDFRQVYASLLQGLWGLDAGAVLGKKVEPVAGLVA